MRIFNFCVTVAALCTVCLAPGLRAQDAVPTRTIGAATKSSKDSVRIIGDVRVLSTGAIMYNEFYRQRIVMFDSSLANMKIVSDSGALANSQSLIPYFGDSTIAVDAASKTLLVYDEKGAQARVMAMPKAADASYLSYSMAFGPVGADAQGRLVYRGTYQQAPGRNEFGPGAASLFTLVTDSAPLVRADFDTRRVDTLTKVRTWYQAKNKFLELDKDSRLILHVNFDMFSEIDSWLAMKDGTIAVINVHDYIIKWFEPNGTVHTSAKLPQQWTVLTDSMKLERMNYARPQVDRLNSDTMGPPRQFNTSGGMRRLIFRYEFTPLSDTPSYEAAIKPGTVHDDLEGNLWIPSHLVENGMLYDVVTKQGVIKERVRIPAGRTIAGFAPNTVVLIRQSKNRAYGYFETAPLH